MAFGFFKKKPTGADTIFYNGTIYTMDPDQPVVQAVACTNGRVSAIGDTETILELEAEETVMVDLEGDFLIPGLIDPAGHPTLEVFRSCSLYLANTLYLDEVLQEMKGYIEQKPEADVYFAYGFREELLAGKSTEESAAILDNKGLSDKPILLLAEGGDVIWLNTPAIEEVRKMAQEDMLPQITLPYILFSLAPFDSNELEKESISLGKRYKKQGFTSVLSCGEPGYMQGVYQQCLVDLYQEEVHYQRFFGGYLVQKEIAPPVLMQRLIQRKTTCMELDDLFNYNMVKLVVAPVTDGENAPLNISRENLMDICMEAGDKGFDVHIDAVDCQALIHSWEAIARMRRAGYRRTTAVIAHEEDLDEINKGLEEPIDFHEAQILESRPTVSVSAPAGAARNRKTDHYFPDLTCFGSTRDLIEYYTLHAAEAIGFENQLGAIKSGYYADFAVFHQDPFQLTPEQFSQLEADMTVINGQPTL